MRNGALEMFVIIIIIIINNNTNTNRPNVWGHKEREL